MKSKTKTRNQNCRGAKASEKGAKTSRNRTRNNKEYRDDREFNNEKDYSNDPAWYANDPSLLRDAASIPFSWATGTKVGLFKSESITTIDETPTLDKDKVVRIGEELVVPGVMAIHLSPWFGYSENQTDPLNIAATSLYSFVRHANSGSANYDAPDLMLYVMAMSQAYSYINFMIRVYGTAMLYVQRNRYIPSALLTAMGVDYQNVQENLAQFRFNINVLINKLSSMAVPADFSLFNRQAFLYQNIYTEGTSIKDQMYMYVPDSFWMYNVTKGQPGSLIAVPFDTTSLYANPDHTLLTVEDLNSYGQLLLDSILLSEDLNIMSGDILKAYGSDRIMKLTSLQPDYVVMPFFDIAVLEQMKNATLMGPVSSLVTTNKITLPNGVSLPGFISQITQNVTTNAITSQPVLGIYAGKSTTSSTILRDAQMRMTLRNGLITTMTAEVTPELIMESTRLISLVQGPVRLSGSMSINGNDSLKLNCGTEVATCAKVYTYDISDSGEATLSITAYMQEVYLDSQVNSAITNPTEPDYTEAQPIVKVDELWRLATFNFAPIYELCNVSAKSGSGNYVVTSNSGGIFTDYGNYAVVTDGTLRRIHETALLSQLHVNSIAHLG